ncbi:TPA: DUF669 domain-containing protein, partial [Staphylococcus aureus]
GKPINIELERKYNDYKDKWNTVLKRFWKFEGTAVYEKVGIKENEKNDNNESSNNSNVNNNPFENTNNSIDISDDDLPF